MVRPLDEALARAAPIVLHGVLGKSPQPTPSLPAPETKTPVLASTLIAEQFASPPLEEPLLLDDPLLLDEDPELVEEPLLLEELLLVEPEPLLLVDVPDPSAPEEPLEPEEPEELLPEEPPEAEDPLSPGPSGSEVAPSTAPSTLPVNCCSPQMSAHAPKLAASMASPAIET
jgi:hypothetical protein